MLDHDFMEFAASLPADLKFRNGQTKYILKQAVRDLLPSDNIDRPKKGFSVPLERWFRHELRELSTDLLLDGSLAQRGYFNANMVRRLLDEHRRGVAAWHNQLWSLVMLESWHRMFIDGRPQPSHSGSLPVIVHGAGALPDDNSREPALSGSAASEHPQ